MLQQLNSSKITLVKKFKINIDILLNFVNKTYSLSVHIKKIDKAYIYLDKLIEFDYSKNILAIIENGILIKNILNIISQEFENIYLNNFAKGIVCDTTMLKNFVDKYSQFKKKYDKIDITLNELIIDSLYAEHFGKFSQSIDHIDEINIISTFQTFSKLFKKYLYALPIYKSITLRLLKQFYNNKQIISSIMDANEQIKSFVISIPNRNLEKNKLPIKDYADYTINNPYLKTFGLVPVSNVMSLSEISTLIFSESSSRLSTFIKLCKDKKYDLIIIQKYLNRGINYALLDLLDYNKSKEFSISNNSSDGITIDTIKRFHNIQYMAPTKDRVDFRINYNYILKSDNKFTIIIEETYPGKFHVLSNIYTSFITYFVRKSSILEFITFITNKSGPHSRVENYNSIINRGILNNMFSGQKYDIKQLEEKSYLPDPNKMRHTIYTNIMEEFNNLKTTFTNIYDFSKLLHNSEFINIFTNILVREYNNIIEKIDYDNVSIAELYSSFIRDLSIYERDFEKKMHDGFISQITEIMDSNIFSKSQLECDTELTEIFNKLLLSVLTDIISIEKNIFQSLDYKLYLLQTK